MLVCHDGPCFNLSIFILLYLRLSTNESSINPSIQRKKDVHWNCSQVPKSQNRYFYKVVTSWFEIQGICFLQGQQSRNKLKSMQKRDLRFLYNILYNADKKNGNKNTGNNCRKPISNLCPTGTLVFLFSSIEVTYQNGR